MESLITIRGLSLTFTRGGQSNTVLSQLDLDVARGEFLAIVGASGVGKSTLLRVIADLARPSGGTVRLAPAPAGQSPFALVFQDARLLPWRRVLSNAAFGLERLKLARAERLKRAQAALDFVGLGHLGQRWPHQLSGGQRQRVSLARALAVDPQVLLMDEPFSALDAITRENLQDEMIRVRRETGKTILFVTHDIEEAVHLADRIIVLSGSPGKITGEYRITQAHPRSRHDADLGEAVRAVRASLGGQIAGETVMDGAAI